MSADGLLDLYREIPRRFKTSVTASGKYLAMAHTIDCCKGGH